MAGSGSHFDPISWRELVAIGVLINDLSEHAIARCAGVPHSEVRAALSAAADEGVLHEDRISPANAAGLVSELSPSVVADVHAAAARYLLSEGPSRLLETIAHFKSAGMLFPSSELAAIADRAGSTSLSVGDYASARQFLEFADEIGIVDSLDVRARRLCQLAASLEGLGLIPEARNRLASAFDLAEIAGDSDIAIDAVVNYAFPVDWYAGDRRATALLQRAELLSATQEHRVKLQAARSMTEMRIPLPTDNGQQIAWVTRPTIAQPLADIALEGSKEGSDSTRLTALIAWRTTHREPAHLHQRRSVSNEAFDLAQQLRKPSRQVDAAVMVAVDSLESGDRPGFDHALAVLRWVAEADKNPRHIWHAYTVAAGAAHIDGDFVAATSYRDRAREVGMSANLPGWFGAELLLLAQEVIFQDNVDVIRAHLPDEASTETLNPIGKLLAGLGHCKTGSHDIGKNLLDRAIRQFEPEASWLLCHTRATDLALHLGDDEVLQYLWSALHQWHEHIAVDSQAWFCDGPVSAWLSLIAHRQNDVDNARHYLSMAEPVARRMGDVRTLDRLAALRGSLGLSKFDSLDTSRALTARETTVLQLMVDGMTNLRIAKLLALSPSTIRNDLTSIYRKLGVASRAEAAAAAISLAMAQQRPKDEEDSARSNW